MVSTIASSRKSQGHCELRMQDIGANSIAALAGRERQNVWIGTFQPWARRRLGHDATRMFSGRSLVNEIVVVSFVSIILLRSSG